MKCKPDRKRKSPKTWAAVEQLYFEGEFSIIEIAEQHQMATDTIYARAKKMKWPPHGALRLEGGFSQRAILRRAIDLKLKHLEKRMQDPDTATPTDSEKQAREYGSLLNTIDKLDAKEKAWRATVMPQTENTQADATHGDDNVEQWRHELARRIASLSAKWQQ